MSTVYSIALNLESKFQFKLSYLINVSFFNTSLRICMLQACFTVFGKADEAVKTNPPGTPERQRGQENNGG